MWFGDLTGMLTVGSTVTLVVFGILSPIATLPAPLAYLVIPLLVWATFQFGLHGGTTSLVLVSAIAVVGTAQGTGPFAHQPTVGSSLLLLQVFMSVISITVLVIAAVLTKRTEAETALRESKARLTIMAAAVPGFLFTNRLAGGAAAPGLENGGPRAAGRGPASASPRCTGS